MKLLLFTVLLALSVTVSETTTEIQDPTDNSDVGSGNRIKRQSTASCNWCPILVANMSSSLTDLLDTIYSNHLKAANMTIEPYTGTDGCLHVNMTCTGLGYAMIILFYGGQSSGGVYYFNYPNRNGPADEVVSVSVNVPCTTAGWVIDDPTIQPVSLFCGVANHLPTTTTTTTTAATTTTKASCTSCRKPKVDRTVSSDELIGVATDDISFKMFDSDECSYVRITCSGVGWASIKARTNSGITIVASNRGRKSSSRVTVQANVSCHAGNWLSDCADCSPINNKFFCDVLSTTETSTTTTVPLSQFLEPYLTPIHRAESGTSPSFHIYSPDARDFKTLLDKYCGTEETDVGKIVMPDNWPHVRTKCPNLVLTNWLRKNAGNPLTAFVNFNTTFPQVYQFYCAAERGYCGANFQLTTILSKDGTRDIFIPSSDYERQATLSSNIGYQNDVHQAPCWIWQ